MKIRYLFFGIALCAFLLGGCLEVLSIPSLSVSADGELMAFLVESEDSQSMSLQVLNLNDGSVQELGSSDTMKGAFDWHPQEVALAYVEISAENLSTIQVSELSGKTTEFSSIPDHEWVNQMAYSPDGSLLALSMSVLPEGVSTRQVLDFSSDLNSVEVRVVLADTTSGNFQEIARQAVGDTPSLSWSPGGTRLAYGFDGHVYSYDLVDGDVSEITWGDNLSLRAPAWLSETQLVMLSAPDPDGEGPSETEIVIHDLVSNSQTSWVVNGNSAVPTPSPDGRYIAFLQGQAAADPALNSQGYASATVNVMLLNVEDGTIETLYAGLSLDRPLWSADSQTLYLSNGNAFSMNVDNRRRIFAVNVETGDTQTLFEGTLATSSLLGWFPPQEEEATESP